MIEGAIWKRQGRCHLCNEDEGDEFYDCEDCGQECCYFCVDDCCPKEDEDA